jgi:hypothetical protein
MEFDAVATGRSGSAAFFRFARSLVEELSERAWIRYFRILVAHRSHSIGQAFIALAGPELVDYPTRHALSLNGPEDLLLCPG